LRVNKIMDSDNPYCSTDVGPLIAFSTLFILLLVCVVFPFSQKHGLIAASICIIGDVFILSTIIVCSFYYLFHLAVLTFVQILLVGLWYKNMIIWQTIASNNAVNIV